MPILNLALDPAGEVGVTLLGGPDREVAVAVEGHVAGIIAIKPEYRRGYGLVPIHHRPLRPIGGGAGGALEVVDEDEVGAAADLGSGSAAALGSGIAAASAAAPVISIKLRRFKSGTGSTLASCS